MSLISEALKKARNEAARREASERGFAYPTVPHHLPVQRPERRIWPWAVGSGALVALALGGLAAVLSWRAPAPPPAAAVAAPPAPRPAPAAVAERAAPSSAEAPSPESSPPAAGARVDGSPPGPPAASARTAASPSPAAATPLPVARVTPPLAAPVPDRAPARVAVNPTAPSVPARATPGTEPPATPAASPAPTAATVAAPLSLAAPLAFVRHAELPGGVRLDLGGIAFSSGQPVALINGRALGPREQIQGYTLTAIEPDVVWLEKGDVRIRLALKD